MLLGPEAVLAGDSERRVYDCDAYTVERAAPTVIALPRTTDEAASVIRLCHRLGVPFTPRGAGTGLSGGATPVAGGVVISTTRMNRILEIRLDDRRMVAQAGCINLALSRAAAPHGLHYAPDPSSQAACTVGGNVAENSGGPHTLKYGVTVNHVLGARLVLPDGRVVDVGGPAEETPGYDLVGFVVGSEGTLGMVTEVTVRLTPLPEAYHTLLAVFDTIDDCTETVSHIIAAGSLPCAIEMIDRAILGAIEDAFHLGLPRDAEAVLIVEFDGPAAGLAEDADRARAVCRGHRAREVREATEERERARLWMARKKAIGAAGRLAPSIVTQDGVIPRSKLPEVLREIGGIAREHGVRICNVFHAGDGNLHPCVLFDERDPDEVRRVVAAGNAILRLCVAVGGSITGEHGIGVEKIAAMSLLFSENDLACMGRLRAVFNALDLCNPGKLLPSSRSCVEIKWRPRAAFV